MDAFTDSLAWHNENYDMLGHWVVSPADKVMLGGKVDKAARVCRFCERSAPEVTFKLLAHALPEAMGNKSIFSSYECDTCNQGFGEGIENDFGNWSKPMRTWMRIRGKTGVPSLKKGSSGGWRVDSGAGGLDIKAYEDDPFFELDEEANRVTFKFKRDPYTPAGVYKAFVKIGLTLLPNEEIGNFGAALAWVREPDHSKTLARGFPILYTFQPGPMPNDLLAAAVFRRKESVRNVPYAFLVLAYGNEFYQVFLPCPARDADLVGQPVNVTRFVSPQSFDGKYGPAKLAAINFDRVDVVKGQDVEIAMVYDHTVGIDAKES